MHFRDRLKQRATRRAFAAAGAALAASGGIHGQRTAFGRQPSPPPASIATPSTLVPQEMYTFLVAGLDTRGVEEDENTDVIMISRVEPNNRRVRTISIPRDLLCEIPGYGQYKINAAYNLAAKPQNHDWNAGAALFRDTIMWNFNLWIDGVVTTNLHTMPGVIDAMGGITVDNPYHVHEDSYPTTDYGVKTIDYPAGELHLNGEQALEYSRTRHMDFDEGRVMRQQIVLSACLAKLQQPDSLGQIQDIYNAGKGSVMTDIPADVQGQLLSNIPNIDPTLVEWGTVVEFLWGGTLPDGGWNYMTDWTFLPYHVRAWLGVGPVDPNRY